MTTYLCYVGFFWGGGWGGGKPFHCLIQTITNQTKINNITDLWEDKDVS